MLLIPHYAYTLPLAVIVERYRNEQQTKGKTIVVGATLGIGIVFANRTQGKKITN